MCHEILAKNPFRCDTCRLVLTKVKGGYICTNPLCPRHEFTDEEAESWNLNVSFFERQVRH